VRIVAGGTAVLEGRMLVFTFGLIFMTHETEVIARLVKEFLMIALVRAMATSAIIFSCRMNIRLAFSNIIVTHQAKGGSGFSG